jgi:hypothetical protein
LGRRTPGHNSLSHVVCSPSGNARHVVRRPGCSRTLAVAICASHSHQCTRALATRREARRFIHSFNRSSWGVPFAVDVRRPQGGATCRWGIHCREAKPRKGKDFVEDFSNRRDICRGAAARHKAMTVGRRKGCVLCMAGTICGMPTTITLHAQAPTRLAFGACKSPFAPGGSACESTN